MQSHETFEAERERELQFKEKKNNSDKLHHKTIYANMERY